MAAKLKSVILPRGADQFPQTGSRYFLALGFLVLSTAPKLPDSRSSGTAVRFTREQLLLLLRVYLRLAMRIAIIYPANPPTSSIPLLPLLGRNAEEFFFLQKENGGIEYNETRKLLPRDVVESIGYLAIAFFHLLRKTEMH